MPSFDYIPSNFELLYCCLMSEGVGTLSHDFAKPHHVATLTGPPTWANLANDLTYLDFNSATPDFLEVAQADSLDLAFTTEDFTLAAWVNPDALPSAGSAVIDRMQGNVGGYQVGVMVGGGGLGMVRFYSYPGALPDWTDSAEGVIEVGTWAFIASVKTGTAVEIFVNGINVTDFQSVHDTLGVPAVKFHVGVYSDEIAQPYDGQMWRPRVWGRALPQGELLDIFAYERDYLGV